MLRSRLGTVVALLPLFVGAACGSETTGPQKLVHHGNADASNAGADSSSHAGDTDGHRAAADITPNDSAVAKKCPGGMRCPCKQDADCDSGHCGEHRGKMVCMKECKPSSPLAEMCDGIDNDCDGETDEDTCSDGNACTSDHCGTDLKCAWKSLEGVGYCFDGELCTVGDTCVDGACKAGPDKDCGDGNPCTADGCSQGECHYSHVDVPCDDGDACTVSDACKTGDCKGVLKLKKPACKACIAKNRAPPSCTKCLPKFTGANCDKCADPSFTGTACDVPVEVPNSTYCKPVATWQSKWSGLENQVVTLVNQQRAKGAKCGATWYGKAPPLKMEGRLRCAARVHSKDMHVSGFFSHTNKAGQSPFTRIKLAGYSYKAAGENIATGQNSPAKAMAGWMKSPGHCRNIMSTKFTQIGVGYYPGGKFGHLWTQTFGKPKF